MGGVVVDGKLTDTVALITGSTGGAGAAVARRLAAEGAAVALGGPRRDRLDDLAWAICRDGGTSLAVPADLTRRREAVGAVENTVGQLGRLDIVVNAAIMPPGSAVDAGTDEWHQIIACTMQGLLHITHAALLHLVQAAHDSPRGVADLVNIDVVAAGRADRLTTSAVTTFSEVIREELRGQRVRVSVVGPDVVRAGVDEVADTVTHIVTRDAGSPDVDDARATTSDSRGREPARRRPRWQ